MTISELIAHVGDANIQVQRVDDFIRAEYKKKTDDVEITFATNQISVYELMRHNGAKHGLIIWLPRDKLPVSYSNPMVSAQTRETE